MEFVVRVVKVACAIGVAGMLGACASSSAGPTAMPMPMGMSCKSVRAELGKLDRTGARGKVEAVKAGRKVSAKARKDVDRYNYLLNVYLGSRCHV